MKEATRSALLHLIAATKTRKEQQMSEEKYSIEIDCPPGWPRPHQLFPAILKDTGLEEKDFELVSRLFGNFKWILRDEASKDQVYSNSREVIKKRLMVLYDQGTIRYASW